MLKLKYDTDIIRKDNYAAVSHEHRHKNAKQNVSKSNPAIYKHNIRDQTGLNLARKVGLTYKNQ